MHSKKCFLYFFFCPSSYTRKILAFLPLSIFKECKRHLYYLHKGVKEYEIKEVLYSDNLNR